MRALLTLKSILPVCLLTLVGRQTGRGLLRPGNDAKQMVEDVTKSQPTFGAYEFAFFRC